MNFFRVVGEYFFDFSRNPYFISTSLFHHSDDVIEVFAGPLGYSLEVFFSFSDLDRALTEAGAQAPLGLDDDEPTIFGAPDLIELVVPVLGCVLTRRNRVRAVRGALGQLGKFPLPPVDDRVALAVFDRLSEVVLPNLFEYDLFFR